MSDLLDQAQRPDKSGGKSEHSPELAIEARGLSEPAILEIGGGLGIEIQHGGEKERGPAGLVN